MSTRIYVVKTKTGAATTESHRLVEATTSAQALRHVAGTIYQVDIAKAKQVAELVKLGTPVEDAQAEAAT
jgi:hypothetical protein